MPPPRALQPFQAKRALAQRLAPLADSVRQIATKLGLRSRRLFLVWTTWTGGVRGEGEQKLIARVEILPTPKVAELTAVQLAIYSGGVLPTGSLRVDLVSAQLSEAQLMGRAIPGRVAGTGIPQPYDFFYEMMEDGRGGDVPLRMRFRVFGNPSRNEGNVCWVLLLERQQEDPRPDGTLPYSE